jgi:hypothetical protein
MEKTMHTDMPMTKLQALLNAIAKLYSGVVATVVHERVHAYHADAANDDDIADALRTYIKQIKQKASTHTAPIDTSSGLAEPALTAETPSGHSAIAAESANTSGISNPLSDYFQKNNAYSELTSPLGEKLKSSAWEHTHSAIRLAHQGDFASAKLHADLANNAIHELGHYMPEADFIAFKRAVKAELLDKT